MSPLDAYAQLLIETMQKNTHHLSSLNQILDQERQLIETSDHKGLIALLEHKEELIESIHQTEQQLLQLLNKYGYKTHFRQAISSDNFVQLASQLPAPLQAAFTQSWTELKTLLIETRQLNSINRRVVEYSKYSVDHLLGILRGSQTHPALYQSNGRYDDFNEHHSLAKA